MAQPKTSSRRGGSSSSSRARSTTGTSKSRSSQRSSSGGSGARAGGSSRPRSTKRPSKGGSTGRSSRGGSATRSRSSVRKQPSARGGRGTRPQPTPSGNGQSTPESVTDTISSGAESTAQVLASTVKKAKVPLIAGGAAIAGLAGAAALNARSSRHKVLGVKVPRRKSLKKVDAGKVVGAVTDTAKRADRFGQRVSSVAKSVQMVSETADRGAKKS
jgi:hypothetical protein